MCSYNKFALKNCVEIDILHVLTTQTLTLINNIKVKLRIFKFITDLIFNMLIYDGMN